MLTVQPTAPGGWLAAVIPGRLAVVHHPEPELIARVWAELGADDGIHVVLDELVRKGLAAVPGFVLAEWNGDAPRFDGRFLVRGSAAVVLETASGGEDITAEGVSTWVERPVIGLRGFRVACSPVEDSAKPALPLVAGAAWVSALSFEADAAQLPVPTDAAEPASREQQGAPVVPAPETSGSGARHEKTAFDSLLGDIGGGFALQLPDGRTEPIDGTVVVGRAPSLNRVGAGRVPRLVTVDSVEHDISRNHVQLTVEGGTVVVTDLHSRNGTLIALPGKAPQKLRAGAPTSVIAGTVIDLGSGVTLGVVRA